MTRWVPTPSPELRYLHEPLDPRAVDRVPGVAIDLEMRADDHAARDGQDVAHIVYVDPGVGEDRNVSHDFADALQVRLVDRLPGIGPETRIASALDENTALFARCSIGRWSSEKANSALMLNISFMSSRPIICGAGGALPRNRRARPPCRKRTRR